MDLTLYILAVAFIISIICYLVVVGIMLNEILKYLGDIIENLKSD